MVQGAEIIPSGVVYRVWAPIVSTVKAHVFSPSGGLLRTIAMEAQKAGYFGGIDEAGRAGDLYKYCLNDSEVFPDPATRWQPEGVHGPSMVIAPSTYHWKDTSWRRPALRDLVIYEMHVGTFSPEGTFRGAMEKLRHVRDVGFNAIEIMPIADFAGARNWGYDGVCLFAPSHSYGKPDDLRSFVDAAHELGITVILDVVYNHFGPDGNYLQAYVGEYLDESAKTPWGGAIRYGDPAFKPLRDWVISNPAYWMREFHFDGFRLDATHAIVDASPRHVLAELTAAIHEHGGFAIAEDCRNDIMLMLPEEKGGLGFDAVWADDFHHSVRVANTGENEGYLGDFTGSTIETVDTLRHGWYYRGQHAKSQDSPRGSDCRDVPPQAFIHCVSNHDQTGNHAFGKRLAHCTQPAALRAAEMLLCFTPYTPMFFMGEEWAASTPFMFFTDHNSELGKLIVEGRREEFKSFAAFQDAAMLKKIPDPQGVGTFENSKLNWEERAQGIHGKTLELCRACLDVRQRHAAFRPVGREDWSVNMVADGIGALRLGSADERWLLLFDLKGGHRGELKDILSLSGEAAWRIVLFSNETRFGGTGECSVNLERQSADFRLPETILLRGQ
jgi:maltooligosyltrehalose trehalohydrolase